MSEQALSAMADRCREIAGDEYRRRLVKARQLVASGELPAARADAEMRAWAAIALLAGAPIMEAEVAEYRSVIVHYAGDGTPARYDHKLPEDEARCDLARDLCGPNIWRPILSRARDAAIAKAIARKGDAEANHRAANLNLLARALDVPLTLASCGMAPVSERKAA